MKNWRLVAFVIFALTIIQLVVGAFAGLEQFDGKAFGARLIFYPLMMLALPIIWALVGNSGHDVGEIPWDATALIMWGFLVDVTGNTLDLYDTLEWWDDANHFFNWITLTLGAGIVLSRFADRPRFLLGFATVGLGCILALLWEVGEWYTFIRHGTELDTAYEDTLGDMLLGTAGASIAVVILMRMVRGDRHAAHSSAGV